MEIQGMSSLGMQMPEGNALEHEDVNENIGKETSGINFGDLLENGLNSLESTQNHSEYLSTEGVKNENIHAHELLIAQEEAQHQMQLAAVVRDEVSDGLNSLLQMQL